MIDERKDIKVTRWVDGEDRVVTVNGKVLSNSEIVDLLVEYMEENRKQVDLIDNLRNELRISAEDYRIFKEVLDEADDLICSHLSKHYQRKWRNFCERMDIYDW